MDLYTYCGRPHADLAEIDASCDTGPSDYFIPELRRELSSMLESLRREHMRTVELVAKSCERLQQRQQQQNEQFVERLLAEQQIQIRSILLEELHRHDSESVPGKQRNPASEGLQAVVPRDIELHVAKAPGSQLLGSPTTKQLDRGSCVGCDVEDATEWRASECKQEPLGPKLAYKADHASDPRISGATQQAHSVWLGHKVSTVGRRVRAHQSIRSYAELAGGISRVYREAPKDRLADVAQSFWFTSLSAMLLAANAIFIGYQCEVGMQLALHEPPKEDPSWFLAVNVTFSILFVCELAFRMVAFRAAFIMGPDWRWNVFETLLVTSSFAAELIWGFNFTDARILRGLRLVRVLRAIRLLRFLTSLRLMVCALLHSLPALLWASMLLVLVMYFFSVVFMQAGAQFLRDATRAPHLSHDGESISDDLYLWYGSFYSTMMSLFMAVTGGNDWWELAKPLADINPVYGLFYCLYIFSMIFGILNILVGVFVDRAFESSSLDKDLVIQAEFNRMDAFMREIKDIFDEIDEQRSGIITRDQFLMSLDDERLASYLQMHQLDLIEPTRFFRLLDMDNSGEISIAELIVGLMHLGGHAKSADLVMLLNETRQMDRAVKSQIQSIEAKLVELTACCRKCSPPRSLS